MATLTCDICGGQLSMDPSGEFAVCESCGMKHTKDRVKVKAQEITGTVKIDDSDKIKEQTANYEKLAAAAYENKNYEEAYIYYCKILEVDVNYWMATFRKGICKGWESNLANIRANEVLGGVVDATKLLLMDESQTDSLRANGKVIMATETYNWIQAVSDLVIEHANQYATELVSSAREFYQRESLIADMLRFNLEMLDEQTYEFYEDKDFFEGLLNTIISASRAICCNMQITLKVKTGSEWDSFWQVYHDVYENVLPDYATIMKRDELNSTINTASSNLIKWKLNYEHKEKERIEKEKRDQIAKFWEDNPDIYSDYQSKNEQVCALEAKVNECKLVLSEAENVLMPLASKYSECDKQISILTSDIEKLKKKIFGKAKALLEVDNKQRKIEELLREKALLEPDKKKAEQIIDECKENLSIATENHKNAVSLVKAILKDNKLD